MKNLGKGIIIRDLHIDDLHQIYKIGKEDNCSTDSFSAENIADLFTYRKDDSLVISRKKKVLGYLISEIISEEIIIRWIGLHSSMKGRNHETELLEYFIDEHTNRGFSKINIDLNENNIETINLFIDKGFTKITSSAKLSLEIK